MLPAVGQPPGVVICYMLLLCAGHRVVVLGHSHGFLCRRQHKQMAERPQSGFQVDLLINNPLWH